MLTHYKRLNIFYFKLFREDYTSVFIAFRRGGTQAEVVSRHIDLDSHNAHQQHQQQVRTCCQCGKKICAY